MTHDPCQICHERLTWGEYNYSMGQFKKPLCQTHQREERVKMYPPKLAEFLNNTIGLGRKLRANG